jgi:hypothetical protein
MKSSKGRCIETKSQHLSSVKTKHSTSGRSQPVTERRELKKMGSSEQRERHLPWNEALELWGKKCIPAGLARPDTPASKKVQPTAHGQKKRKDEQSIQRKTHITCRIGIPSGEYHAHFDVPGSETKLVPALKHAGAVVEIVVLCRSKRCRGTCTRG